MMMVPSSWGVSVGVLCVGDHGKKGIRDESSRELQRKRAVNERKRKPREREEVTGRGERLGTKVIRWAPRGSPIKN